MSSRTRGRRFADRFDAGTALAAELRHRYTNAAAGVVLALPRGGVPVAAPVAQALRLPLDVLIVRKLGVPGHEELAMGALAALGGTIRLVRNEPVLAAVGVSDSEFDAVVERETTELRRRTALLRGDRPPPGLSGLVVVVDDGLATGSTMRAALEALRGAELGAGEPGIGEHRAGPPPAPVTLVVAVPVGAADTCQSLARIADVVVCLETPQPFFAVGQAYADFTPPDENSLRALLTDPADADHSHPAQTGDRGPSC